MKDIHNWFELTYAQYLTIPRAILEAMPDKWQRQMAALLTEMDETFDWRPHEGRYWVTLKDGRGRFVHDPLQQYRHANVAYIASLRKTQGADAMTYNDTVHSYGSLYQPGPGGSPGRFLTLEELRENYTRIVRIIDDACADAEKQKPPIRGAINWGDLSCADVGIKNDGYYAVVEEAAPGCTELIAFVQDRLQAADFGNVDVTTEW